MEKHSGTFARRCLHCKHEPGLGWTCRGSASAAAALERRSACPGCFGLEEPRLGPRDGFEDGLG